MISKCLRGHLGDICIRHSQKHRKKNFHCKHNLDGYFWIREYYHHQTNSNDNNIKFQMILNKKPKHNSYSRLYFWLHEKSIFFPPATVDLPLYSKQHRHFILHTFNITKHLTNLPLSFFFFFSLNLDFIFMDKTNIWNYNAKNGKKNTHKIHKQT